MSAGWAPTGVLPWIPAASARSLSASASRTTHAHAGTAARGTFGPDATFNTFADAACQGEAAGATWSDAEVPAPDAGFYYLVAVRDACWTSHHGTRSDGTVCPVSPCP